MDYSIKDEEQLKSLWVNIYNKEGKPDWSHILPYYDNSIYFHDSVQEINGISDFTRMTERLIKRSSSLEMEVVNSSQNENVIFLEWIMTLRFKRLPKSSIFGLSRITLNSDGKIIEQRDYYDLWGDIYDNIPVFRRIYRFFMRKIFG